MKTTGTGTVYLFQNHRLVHRAVARLEYSGFITIAADRVDILTTTQPTQRLNFPAQLCTVIWDGPTGENV